ncbi:AP endonuclease [Flavobacterium branchiophilum]|uniref:Xylose isomerase-like TIM barrel n=2 Tax=Flavobacterium branchiophilum TaxID=55197 RepID=G2Z3V1_FLABF|nr:sugar phosphate isomerase/epimerase [Flavobacterium branchiophilum]OXA72228.1 AP endonuclease [Flavobacterium branchiophilum] [Flavobacterium branchiophilum NBRC 15030 = ATCC 35035]PDS23175.1 sugar phosphate isomerase/epimerase [Flavobacterium branchiophilum]TQM40617.1 sugar phosphate isomerase/epimerase [Flavobacterium branchiophilum]CCB68282.1 Xylose isomerase-like TIM barrel [Flavobacterium branchiophilum FL-15]GEM55978.1 AP endonuclease [Flavobacterium branchiophilum NBRC 15030 = ATCC 3
MVTIKGPALFLAQFYGDQAPFDTIDHICQWAASLGYKGVQIPTWDNRYFDLQRIAEDPVFAQEYKAKINSYGLEITELSTHLQGQLIAVNPAYDALFDGFAPDSCKNNPAARYQWAVQQLLWAAKASEHLGLQAHATFSGSLLWHTVYPWPQRPAGIVDDGFTELAKRWTPILNAFDQSGVDLCYEVHAGEDLHDGVSYERFLDKVHQHPRACLLYDPSHFILQCLDYVAYIDHYHERIKACHIKDAEFHPNGKQGVYGGYQNWTDRAGRFRSLGDGQVDFKQVFSKLAHYDFPGWAVLEWECCYKNQEDGAKEGAIFIDNHIIRVTDKAFDDFAGKGQDNDFNKKVLGI